MVKYFFVYNLELSLIWSSGVSAIHKFLKYWKNSWNGLVYPGWPLLRGACCEVGQEVFVM